MSTKYHCAVDIKYHCVECGNVWSQEPPAKECPVCGAGPEKIEVHRDEEE